MFPAIVQNLLPVIGFPWTMRVLRFLTSGMLLLSFFRLEQRVPPRKSGPIVECRAFLEPAYLLFSIGIFLNFRGLYIAFFYISSFAKQHIGFTEDKSIDLILIMNGVGILARTVPNYLADRFTGPLNLLILSTLLSSVMLWCWIRTNDAKSLYIFVVFYGIFAASI